jgi:uncharacterized protein (DUF305 family)
MFSTLSRRVARPLGLALALTLFVPALVSQPAPVSAAATRAPAKAAPFDQQFIDMMTPHHMSAVAMAQIALTRAQHPQIKRLAQAIVSAQDKEIGQMKAYRKAWYGSATTPSMDHMPMLPGLPMGDMRMGMTMMGDIAHLKTAKPFDRAFIDAMLPHHQMAIDAAKLELANGSHPQLKALALSIIQDQAREQGLMQAYRELWYGGSMGSMPGM